MYLTCFLEEMSLVKKKTSEEGSSVESVKYFDIYRERPVRLTVRALVPAREHPKVIIKSSEIQKS